MQLHGGVYWSAGVSGGGSQDGLSLQHTALRRGECMLAVVCDGIGSMAGSQEAGSLVVRSLTDWYYHEGKQLFFQNSSKELILLALQEQFFSIQKKLVSFQQKNRIQIGTTCSGLLLVKGRYYLFHIGDSRIYRLGKSSPFWHRRQAVKCLTKDDTDARGRLKKCLGVAGLDRPVLETGRLGRRTGFLLCTDGFYRYCRKEWMLQSLLPLMRQQGRWDRNDTGKEQIDRRLEQLGEQAIQAGSRDHLSAICILADRRSRRR